MITQLSEVLLFLLNFHHIEEIHHADELLELFHFLIIAFRVNHQVLMLILGPTIIFMILNVFRIRDHICVIYFESMLLLYGNLFGM